MRRRVYVRDDNREDWEKMTKGKKTQKEGRSGRRRLAKKTKTRGEEEKIGGERERDDLRA